MRLDDVTGVRERVVSCAAASVTAPAVSAMATATGKNRMIRLGMASLSLASPSSQLRGRVRTGRSEVISPSDGTVAANYIYEAGPMPPVPISVITFRGRLGD